MFLEATGRFYLDCWWLNCTKTLLMKRGPKNWHTFVTRIDTGDISDLDAPTLFCHFPFIETFSTIAVFWKIATTGLLQGAEDQALSIEWKNYQRGYTYAGCTEQCVEDLYLKGNWTVSVRSAWLLHTDLKFLRNMLQPASNTETLDWGKSQMSCLGNRNRKTLWTLVATKS